MEQQCSMLTQQGRTLATDTSSTRAINSSLLQSRLFIRTQGLWSWNLNRQTPGKELLQTWELPLVLFEVLSTSFQLATSVDIAFQGPGFDLAQQHFRHFQYCITRCLFTDCQMLERRSACRFLWGLCTGIMQALVLGSYHHM